MIDGKKLVFNDKSVEPTQPIKVEYVVVDNIPLKKHF